MVVGCHEGVVLDLPGGTRRPKFWWSLSSFGMCSLTFMISISFFRWWFSSKANLQSISPPLCSPEPRRFHRDGNRFRQPSSFAAPPRHFLTPTRQPNVIHLCLLPPPWFARTSNRRCPHLIYDVPCHRSTTTTPKDPPAGLELADPQLH